MEFCRLFRVFDGFSEYLASANNELNANHILGYSYWLAVLALILMSVGTLLGFMVTSQEKHPDIDNMR